MAIDWFSFFLGAPIWGSLGVLVFACLLAAGKHVAQVRRERADPRAGRARSGRRALPADAPSPVDRPAPVRARADARGARERRIGKP